MAFKRLPKFGYGAMSEQGRMIVKLNPRGNSPSVVFNAASVSALGNPTHIFMLFDEERKRLGFQPMPQEMTANFNPKNAHSVPGYKVQYSSAHSAYILGSKPITMVIDKMKARHLPKYIELEALLEDDILSVRIPDDILNDYYL